MTSFNRPSYHTWLALFLISFGVSGVQAAPPRVDYFFPAGGQRGTTIEVTASGAFERWPNKAFVEGAGVTIQPQKTSGKLAITIAKDAEPGVRWIRLHDDDGASIARPFFVGVLPEVLEKEPNDDSKKPQVLERPNVVVNGRLEKLGDVDAFAVKLTKGQTLVASVEANRTLRSPMDGVLQILSADGFVLEQNDDYHGLDPQIAFTVPKDGTYLVRVFAFPSVPDASIRFAGKDNFIYRLTLTTGPFVEYAFPLCVSRTGPGEVELIGWNLPEDLRRLRVVPREGEDVFTVFDTRLTNPFSVQISSRPCFVRGKDKIHALTLPATVTGRLDRPRTSDMYQVSAKKGDKLSFRIAARTLGFALDPVLRLSDDAGKMLQQTKAAKIGDDAALDYTAPRDGVYRLEVADLHGDGGMRYVYRLDAGPITPDFQLKVTTDAFRLFPGKPLEIPVTQTRVGGFSQEVTLSIDGLPKGIAVTTTGKAITLRLEEKTAFAGPFRIIGTAKDGTRRMTRATIAESGRTTDSLWLSTSR
jgi:hypothetical protein